MTRTIWVTWSFVGFHRYPTAPHQVIYLASKHRHTFNVKVELEVDINKDRELEFHMVKNLLARRLSKVVDDQDTGSCEAICTLLHDIVRSEFGGRRHSITVDEDGECGSTLNVA